MAFILKFVIDFIVGHFGSLATKAARDALKLSFDAVMDRFDGDPEWTPDTQLEVQNLILEVLRGMGFHGASSTEGGAT